MQSTGEAITLFGSGSCRKLRRISGHIRFRSGLKKLESGTLLTSKLIDLVTEKHIGDVFLVFDGIR